MDAKNQITPLPPLLGQYVESGWLGRKSGRDFTNINYVILKR